MAVLGFNEFSDLTASSASFKDGEDGRRRRVLHAVEWKQSDERKTVYTRTFHAGELAICKDPDGVLALNAWRPIARWQSIADVAPFLQQERATFLDWLAHIEQCPGVLPHYGWLHIAKNTGTGRNWLASVLARVWRGYPDFIVKTKAGKIIALETKGDDRDNTDSELKLKLGKLGASKAGRDFRYMMVFENNSVAGAERLSDALNKIPRL